MKEVFKYPISLRNAWHMTNAGNAFCRKYDIHVCHICNRTVLCRFIDVEKANIQLFNDGRSGNNIIRFRFADDLATFILEYA